MYATVLQSIPEIAHGQRLKRIAKYSERGEQGSPRRIWIPTLSICKRIAEGSRLK